MKYTDRHIGEIKDTIGDMKSDYLELKVRVLWLRDKLNNIEDKLDMIINWINNGKGLDRGRRKERTDEADRDYL